METNTLYIQLKEQGAFDPGMMIDGQLDGLNSPLHP